MELFGDTAQSKRRRRFWKIAASVLAILTVISLLAGSVLPFLER